MSETATEFEHTNRLIDETSPYLLQHAHNPVDWYPWGEEAIEKARSEQRPILLSIGYSSCHWCHVMERESFENSVTAALMNKHYVNIKVDREERPDLDDIYMAATLAMNQGQGGWPMTVFLTPDLEPVFAGTYFPPEDQHGRPGFPSLLENIAAAWNGDREQVVTAAANLVSHLKQRVKHDPPLSVGQSELQLALSQFANDFDETFGGFGGAPKFPSATNLSLLLRLHRRFDDAHALHMVCKTLDSMAQGGLYDHVGGGFSRYSTDRQWLVPHFEKMLYDNALLASVYLEAFQVTREERYSRVVTETLDYVLREMTSEEGGFYSATDADSEGVEGKYFVWSPQDVEAVLGVEDAAIFNSYYDITSRGNWEGNSIPNTPRPIGDVAKQFDEEPDALRQKINGLRDKIYKARLQRVAPGLDDKVLTAWNGMMIGALAKGSRVLGSRRYLDAARRAADFLLDSLSAEDGGLLRTYRCGEGRLRAYLEDYAFLSDGLIDLFEAGGGARYLKEAERLLVLMVDRFADADGGGFYHTASSHEQLPLRYREGTDGATPAANAVAASALIRASCHLGRDDFRQRAIHVVRAYGSMISRYPRAFAKSLAVVDFILEDPAELAIVGVGGSEDFAAMKGVVGRRYLPNSIYAELDTTDPGGADELPLLRGKGLVNGATALFVCRQFTCQAPVTNLEDAANALDAIKGAGAVTTIGARISGHATNEGTKRYAGRYEPQGYRQLGSTGITTSIVGFGGYRVTGAIDEHREALTRALLGGVNLIDTSTNYMDGGSERLVGSVLRELIGAGDVARDELIVVSKIGYIQGENFAIAEQREKSGTAYPDVVKIQNGMWHCIDPTFIADQLQRSLDRLELESLDVCLLHNPEYFFGAAVSRGESLTRARDEFYRRVEKAFAYLETQISAGRLRYYGVSSNTVVLPPTEPGAVSVSRLAEAAHRVGGDGNSFAVLQAPLNLYESGAVYEANTGPSRGNTVLEAAGVARLAVLANRPLNALAEGSMIRLADFPEAGGESDWRTQLHALAEMEDSFRADIAPAIKVDAEALQPNDYFRWAERLERTHSGKPALEQWSQIEGQVSYAVGSVAATLGDMLTGEVAERWSNWRDGYVRVLKLLLQSMREAVVNDARASSVAASAAIDPKLPSERRGETLSRKALWVVASTPGVSCVLCGMRTVEYVEDALGVLGWEPLEDTKAVYSAVIKGP